MYTLACGTPVSASTPKRLLPGREGLPRQPGNQVHAEVGDACRAQPPDILKHHRPAVQPPADGCLAVNERLHAQADAIYPGCGQRFQRLVRKLPRRALHGDLGIRRKGRTLPAGRKTGAPAARAPAGWAFLRPGRPCPPDAAVPRLFARPRRPCEPYLE